MFVYAERIPEQTFCCQENKHINNSDTGKNSGKGFQKWNSQVDLDLTHYLSCSGTMDLNGFNC
jgi:hypothetical protein